MGHLLTRERPEMIAHRDALAQLAQTMAVEAVAQFRLADQHDLQQLAVVSLKVREQADLFKQVFGQILRLVNDEHGVPALFDLFQQKLIDERQGVQPIQSRWPTGRPNSVAMAFINSSALSTGIQNQRGGIPAVELFQHRAAQRRLARAHLAGKLHETLALADAVKQMVQRFAVLAALEKKTRVRREVERRLL